MAIQQAIIIASIQDRHSAKLDAKFDKLTNAEDFKWWLSQVKGRLLQHDAWRNNVLDDGKPCVATVSNKTISNKLHKHFHQSMLKKKHSSLLLCRFRRAPPPATGRPELLAPKGPREGHRSRLSSI
jgi:hypothetical protein